MTDGSRPKAGSQRSRAVLFLLLSAVLWSTGGLLIKSIIWHPVAIAGARSIIAAFFVWAIVRRPRLTWSWPQICGALAYTASVILFVLANKMTTAANAILLQYTMPVYVALLSAWLLHERVSWRDWATIFLVLGGMALFFLDRLTAGGLWGNILAVASGFTMACLVLCLRKQKDGSPLESILFGNILTGLISLPFIFAAGAPREPIAWPLLGLLGVLQLGLPYVLYATAIKEVTALEAVLIPVIEPLLNPLWAFLFLSELPGPWALTGGAVVLITVTARCVFAALGERGKPENARQETAGYAGRE